MSDPSPVARSASRAAAASFSSVKQPFRATATTRRRWRMILLSQQTTRRCSPRCCAAWLVVLAISPFTAPFMVCEMSAVIGQTSRPRQPGRPTTSKSGSSTARRCSISRWRPCRGRVKLASLATAGHRRFRRDGSGRSARRPARPGHPARRSARRSRSSASSPPFLTDSRIVSVASASARHSARLADVKRETSGSTQGPV